MRDDPDRDILDRCGSPDPEVRERAFEALHGRHAGRVYRLAYRMTGHDAEARDIAQEVFLRAFRRMHRFRGEAAFTSWIHRVTVNIGIDRMRHSSRRPAVSLEENTRGPSRLPGRSTGPTPEGAAELHEMRDSVRSLVSGLSAPLAAVILLRYGEDLSYAEVGEALGIPVGTVKSRLNRAHALLEPHLLRLRAEGD